MAEELSAPPALSTPAEHTFDEDPTSLAALERSDRPPRSDDELRDVYEIARTAAEIRDRAWRRVALQFPDAMLGDAPWVVQALSDELRRLPPKELSDEEKKAKVDAPEKHAEDSLEVDYTQPAKEVEAANSKTRLYILADTSYSACCVDEIAAEHADANAVVHYGRACLSPTARLPVLHIFTRQQLDYDAVVDAFEKEFPDKAEKVVLMADVMFQEHVEPICDRLRHSSYASVVATTVVRDPTGTIPNRKLISFNPTSEPVGEQSENEVDLKDWHLFHISNPPTSLLLTLSSRLASLHLYATPSSPYSAASATPDPSATPGMLGRRYGLVIRLATASIIGILVNTLSVQNYQSTISKLKEQIAAAGKKSYTIVVGKLNTAKLANFAEIDGWVVVGCWESGLVEQEGLWKPVVTPFELGLALAGDDKRIWDGSWWGGIEGVDLGTKKSEDDPAAEDHDENDEFAVEAEGGVEGEESEPPEFDLRTGKLISHGRPMRLAVRNAAANGGTTRNEQATTTQEPSSALIQRKTGELATINGVASPGAEYLRSQRTWQGLGSDFNNVDDPDEESTIVEEGRSGVARGYAVGENTDRT